jgi:hypothetical protein
MTPNPYDQACRYLLRLFAGPVLAWLLRLSPGQLDFVCWLDTRGLPWPGQPDRVCDTVAHLRDNEQGGLPFAIPVEFQIDPDAEMFGRGLGYLGDLWRSCWPTPHRGDRFEVGLVVVNLRGTGNCSRVMKLSGTSLQTGLWVVERNLSRLSAKRMLWAIKGGRVPVVLLVWIPLFRGADQRGIMLQWKKLALLLTDADVRRVLPLVLLFAEAAGRVELWREALEGLDMIESQIVKEWTALARQEGIKEGIKEGKKEGLREGKVDTLLRILRRKPGGTPADLEQAICAVEDLDRLDSFIETVLSTATVEDFRRTVGL